MSEKYESADPENVALVAGIHMVLTTMLGIAVATLAMLLLQQGDDAAQVVAALYLFAQLPRLADNYRLQGEIRREAQEEANIYPG